MQAVRTFKEENPGVTPSPLVKQAKAQPIGFGDQATSAFSSVLSTTPLLPTLLKLGKKANLKAVDQSVGNKITFSIPSLQISMVEAAQPMVKPVESIPVIGKPISSIIRCVSCFHFYN